MTAGEAAPDSVVIERVYPAPVELVWQLWTDADHFAAWYGPDGASVSVTTMDVRIGGTRLVSMQMHTPRGPMQLWFTGEYREVVPNRRLVYTESMADEHGKVLPAEQAGLPDGHLVTTLVTVELQDVDGHTRLTLTHRGVPAGSGGAAGWTMALDKLAALVDRRRS